MATGCSSARTGSPQESCHTTGCGTSASSGVLVSAVEERNHGEMRTYSLASTGFVMVQGLRGSVYTTPCRTAKMPTIKRAKSPMAPWS
ncbi:hypothetical protein PybrP1_006679 [[Pythium] brassicae (nom. inval.)]|nr:hypothetical protein PybrP1_006679 [[Pythium] brassicae (nom. inval.)]